MLNVIIHMTVCWTISIHLCII